MVFVDLNACGMTERVHDFSSGMNVPFPDGWVFFHVAGFYVNVFAI